MRENESANGTSFFSDPDENVVPNAPAPRSRCDREVRQQSIGTDSKSHRARMKIHNGSTDVAADVENDFRCEGRRHIILSFLTAPEQHLIQNKWIGATRSIKNVLA